MDYTLLSFSGRLVDDPEVLKSSAGTPICKFTVAVNKRIGGEEKTSFIPTTVFGRQAEICGDYLSKGREVRVNGELETDSYTDRNGVSRKGFSCVVGLGGVVEFGTGGRKASEEMTDTAEVNRSAAARAGASRVRESILKGKRPLPRKR